MSKEMLKEADEWLSSMNKLLSEKTDEGDRAYMQKRIDLFNWLIEQAERAQDLEVQIHGHKYHINKLEKQNKRYREAREEIEFLWDRTYKRNANEYAGGRLDGLDIAMNIIDEALEESE